MRPTIPIIRCPSTLLSTPRIASVRTWWYYALDALGNKMWPKRATWAGIGCGDRASPSLTRRRIAAVPFLQERVIRRGFVLLGSSILHSDHIGFR